MLKVTATKNKTNIGEFDRVYYQSFRFSEHLVD